MSSLLKFLGEMLAWLLDVILWAPRKLFELALDGFATVIEAIPVPSWLSGADPFASLDPGVVYFAEAFMIPEGIAIALGAYLIRFLVRRIPLIG
jgi:hypothetical protein